MITTINEWKADSVNENNYPINHITHNGVIFISSIDAMKYLSGSEEERKMLINWLIQITNAGN